MSKQPKSNESEDYYALLRSEVADFVPAKYSKVLEIGCARGRFRSNLSSVCEYWGIEPTVENAREAEKRLSRVLIGRYEDVESELPDNYFDLIICNDVIEHMTDENAFLSSIRVKMASNGNLIGSIPNVRYVRTLLELLAMKDWRYRDSGILDRTHLRFFTEKSLKRLFDQHQFSIVEFHGINSVCSKGLSMKSVFANVIMLGVQILTLGYYSDIKYLQFGFCVRKIDSEAGSACRSLWSRLRHFQSWLTCRF